MDLFSFLSFLSDYSMQTVPFHFHFADHILEELQLK